VPPFWPALACQSACNVLGQTRGVLAQIEPDRAEAEDLNRPADWPHEVFREIVSAAFDERIFKSPEVDEKLVSIGVAGSAEGMAAFDTRDGKLQLAQHAEEELPVRFARITLRYSRTFRHERGPFASASLNAGERGIARSAHRHALQQRRKMLLINGAGSPRHFVERTAGDVIRTKGLPSRSPPIHEPNWKNGVSAECSPDRIDRARDQASSKDRERHRNSVSWKKCRPQATS